MKSSPQAPIAIIGAGIAGLTAAVALRRHNVPVVLYETGSKIAGLAQSFHDEDGFSYDFGPHFITNRLAAALVLNAAPFDTTAKPFGFRGVPMATHLGCSRCLGFL
ncbi:MAG: FAD-dependent oxidoreductase [Thermosynechococcaceae cyanobacterium]